MHEEFWVDLLRVHCYPSRDELGASCAKFAAEQIRAILAEKEEANLIFASSPSQMDVLNALRREDVDWSRVNAFHMDEYIGIAPDHKASFVGYLRDNFFQYLPLKNTFYMNGLAADIEAECERYSALLREHPIDLTFAGIGENGHMAFNDPYLADFFDPKLVKPNLSLDEECRMQQVHDKWFSCEAEVPQGAITLTMPTLLRAPVLIVISPSETKSAIVQKCLEGPVGLAVPATAMRLHKNAQLFLDTAAAALLNR